jgi:hypothetical protein
MSHKVEGKAEMGRRREGKKKERMKGDEDGR